jgi:hypothetical protein
MSKLRFAIGLPILALCGAFAVARWEHHIQAHLPPTQQHPFISTATLVYEGINAPALSFKGVLHSVSSYLSRRSCAPSVFGLGIGELLFLTGVVVLWFIVGLALDYRRHVGRPPVPWFALKFAPSIVTEVPTAAAVGERLATEGRCAPVDSVTLSKVAVASAEVLPPVTARPK